MIVGAKNKQVQQANEPKPGGLITEINQIKKTCFKNNVGILTTKTNQGYYNTITL